MKPCRCQGSNATDEGVLAMSQRFADYVHALSEADLQEPVAFRLFNGKEDTRPRATR